MKRLGLHLGSALLLLLSGPAARGATRYVDAANATPLAPYDSWNKAARKIQDAVDACADGDLVLVTNGTYASIVLGANRVEIDKAIAVRSVNGPAVTTIAGGLGVRCAWIASNAVLAGFTLADGQTRTTGDLVADQCGGGAWIQTNGVLTNCVVTGCSATADGGGIYGGCAANCVLSNNVALLSGGGAAAAELVGCRVVGNRAMRAGGAYGAILRQCELSDNVARTEGGGADASRLYDSFLHHNRARSGGGVADSLLYSCTVAFNEADYVGGVSGYLDSGIYNGIVFHNQARMGTPADVETPTFAGLCSSDAGLVAPPRLVGIRNPHLLPDSPCIGAGTNLPGFVAATDFDGEPRLDGDRLDLGCDQVHPALAAEPLVAAIVCPSTPVVAGTERVFLSDVRGSATAIVWQVDGGSFGATNEVAISCRKDVAADYDVVLRAWDAAGTTASTVHVHVVAGFTNCVSPAGTHVPPFTNWTAAATDVQSAIDACAAGGTVLVADGVYGSGSIAYIDELTSRILVTNQVHVRSVNGPAAAILQGRGPNGPLAIRCAVVESNSSLSGFTLTDGATLVQPLEYYAYDVAGGGVWAFPGSLVSNCVISSCSASYRGGGAYGGTLVDCRLVDNAGDGAAADAELIDCVVSNNAARGTWSCVVSGGEVRNNRDGGARYGSLTDVLLRDNACAGDGGGAREADLARCVVVGNSAEYGGGLYLGSATDCVVASNVASASGGGAAGATYQSVALRRCTLAGNAAAQGGGAYRADLDNCFVVSNSAALFGGGLRTSAARHCALLGNSAGSTAGGALYGTLDNCTVAVNFAVRAGGTYGGTVRNSIVFHNRAASGASNHYQTVFFDSCTAPDPLGARNLVVDPGLVSIRNPHLLADSPCRGRGTWAAWMAGTADLDGDPLPAADIDVGCDQYRTDSAVGPLAISASAAYAVAAVGYPLAFQSEIDGIPAGLSWNWGAGDPDRSSGTPTHAFDLPGTYDVVLSVSNSTASCCTTVRVEVVAQPIFHVATNGAHVPPFADWANAATNMQAAVDLAVVPGSLIWVSNGIYSSGSTVVGAGIPNRLVATNPVTVRGFHGPDSTCLAGAGPAGPAAIRGAYLANGATLADFTVSNGNTAVLGDAPLQISGGGILAENGGSVSNCVVRDCTAQGPGGGAHGVRLLDSTLADNRSFADGGGLYYGEASRCLLSGNHASDNGGGLAFSSAERCVVQGNEAGGGGGGLESVLRFSTLSSNAASDSGGALLGGTAQSCRVLDNRSDQYGGGLSSTFAYAGQAYHCLFAGNSAPLGGAMDASFLEHCTVVANHAETSGGGIYNGELDDCIVYDNTSAGTDPDVEFSDEEDEFSFCCAPVPLPGTGNFTNAPLFADAANRDYSLSSASPCIDAGAPGLLPWDLDGHPRPLDGNADLVPAWDVGACEYVSAVADTDGDGMRDGDEDVAGTDSTDPESLLAFVSYRVETDALRLAWPSVANRRYSVFRAPDFTSAVWTAVAECTNLPGTGGTIERPLPTTPGARESFRIQVERESP